VRVPLWEIGYDYPHGTGHGVGHFLNVHESPPNISSYNSNNVLMHHALFSVEPGWYKENSFGVRIEDLFISVIENGFLRFVNVTMVPIQWKLVDEEMLGGDVEFVKGFNRRCGEILRMFVESEFLDVNCD